LKKIHIDRKTARNLFMGYILLAFFGAFLLQIEGVAKKDISFIDALFTSASAISMTGLIVKNTATDFNFLGQCIILFWIQIGGLGYMGFGMFIYALIRSKIGFSEKNLLKDSLAASSSEQIIPNLKKIVYFVFIAELIGAVLLIAVFALEMPFKEALWHGFFHSISAFNNAGFSTFEAGFMNYRSNFWINTIVTSLIIIGGVGYFVVLELVMYQRKRILHLSLHSKIVLLASAILVIGGTIVVFLFEYSNAKSLGELSLFDKILASYFASVNYRTSGFNTLDFSAFKDASLFFGSLMMMIGGGSGGTAGGIKVITVAVLAIYTYSLIKNAPARAFRQEIPQSVINKALVIFLASGIYIIICTLILSLLEQDTRFLWVFFEVSSAFATVGLSVGNGGTVSLSALFSDASKALIIIMMISGRIGIFAFLLAIFLNEKNKYIKYPEGKIYL